MNSKLLPYALDFTSYLLQKLKHKDLIKAVILFGSVARNEDDASSDVDLFIDVMKEGAIEKECADVLKSFLVSTKHVHYWKLLGVKNELKLHIGQLETWKELQPSLIADGFILYGKYTPQIKEGKYGVFFIWENIHPNTKRVLFSKQLFGYTQNKKYYLGLLQKYGAERLGKGSILVPLEHSAVIHKHFKKYRVPVKIKKVLLY